VLKLRILLHAFWHGIRLIPKAWRFTYQDAKVIWEQGGELSYYRVSAVWQRVVVRGALVLTGAGLLSLGVSAWHSWQVVQEREQLARAHVQIQTALSQALPEVPMTTTQGVNTQQVLDLTARIQERDWLIQTLIQSTSSRLAADNRRMDDQLRQLGIDARMREAIVAATPRGGATGPHDAWLNDKLPSSLLQSMARNSDLRVALQALPSQYPLRNTRVTSDYGMRRHPITGRLQLHAGTDMVSDAPDDRVFAVRSGVVTATGKHPQYGLMVTIQHDGGVVSRYAHLRRIKVKPNQRVGVQTPLGLLGSTGMSTGKHLHLEIFISGKPVNPDRVLRMAQHVQQVKTDQR